ncbi:helix-turn-helix transcriptional regulator [Couchioplanes caeruleus]|uniref:helix-turn-helix transcriptional regulator n=1 Tax=Couchioplanes caeruleus TaxID=56438 RepID=UPI0009FE698E|nr:LuxR family transcriptional regulator [Couchioplanes caeruleus]
MRGYRRVRAALSTDRDQEERATLVDAQGGGAPTGLLAGRDRELGILRRALVEPGGSWCVGVAGDPGIGKSRLLSEFGELAGRAGLALCSARASEFELHVPFGVFVDALDDLLAELGPERLAELGEPQLTLLAAAFPAISAAARIDLVDVERYRLHRAIRSLLELAAGPTGLVLALDDLHWADEGTVELLDHLLRHPPRARLVLALSCRNRQVSPRLWQALCRAVADGTAELLELAPLSRAEAEPLLPAELSGARREDLYRASAGNPFYLDALVRADRDGPAPGEAPPGSDGELPAAVHAALTAELAALDPHQRTVAHAAAVVGDDFDAGLLAEAAALATEPVLEALDELVHRDLVRPGRAAGLFRFRHPLVRAVAYRDAGPGWRLRAHGRAAAALRSRGAAGVELAHHVERSAVDGDLEAVAVLAEAAEATLHTTPSDAGHFLRAALRLLPDAGPTTPQRLYLLGRLAKARAATGDLRGARMTLHEVLRLLPAQLTSLRAETVRFCATVERLLGRHIEARAMLEGEWRRTADDDPHAAAGLVVALAAGEVVERGAGARRTRTLEAIEAARRTDDHALLAMALSIAALAPRADPAAPGIGTGLDEAAALVDALPDGELVRNLEAVLWLGWAEASADRLTAASRHLERGLQLARAGGQTHVITALNAVHGMVHAYLGELAEAMACFADGLESAELTGSDELRTMALTFGCWITTWRGDLDEALRLGKEALAAEEGMTVGLTWRSGQAAAMLGQAMLHSGDPHTCIELLLTAGGGAELSTIEALNRPVMYQLLTEAEVRRGRFAAAADWAGRAEAAAAAVASPVRSAVAQLARVMAMMPVDPALAAPLALAAAAAFARVGVAVEAGRAHLLAAVAFATRGSTGTAREHFDAARTLFLRCDARLFLPHVAREERRMNARRPRPGADATPVAGSLAGRFGLTGREREVAALVSAGLTNREVGRRLHLSPKTVEVHLSRVYAKLGVSGRTALAGRWAAEASAE